MTFEVFGRRTRQRLDRGAGGVEALHERLQLDAHHLLHQLGLTQLLGAEDLPQTGSVSIDIALPASLSQQRPQACWSQFRRRLGRRCRGENGSSIGSGDAAAAEPVEGRQCCWEIVLE